jgi:hypothetical protein
MNETLQLPLSISQRLLARHAAWTANHLMEIRLYRKNERTSAAASGHDDQLAVGAGRQLNHSSDVALEGLITASLCVAHHGRATLKLR